MAKVLPLRSAQDITLYSYCRVVLLGAFVCGDISNQVNVVNRAIHLEFATLFACISEFAPLLLPSFLAVVIQKAHSTLHVP